MQKREKILAIATGGIALTFVLAFGFHRFVIQELQDIDRRTEAAAEQLHELRQLEMRALRAQANLQAVAARTHADNPDEAAAAADARIAQLIEQAGLNAEYFTRTPAGQGRMRGGQEVGWNIRGRESIPLDKVVDLLFLLRAEPTVGRVENVTLAAGDNPGEVRMQQLRYITLVIDAVAPPMREPLEPAITLAHDERRIYDGITRRDLFRPYIKRPPPPPPPPAPPQQEVVQAAPPPAPLRPGPESYRIVSLSEWRGEQEVHVLDTHENRTQQYHRGDELAGGRIVMIDYRPLRLPSDPLIRSQSRVIVEIDNQYWAVERGQTLAEKRVLAADQLPDSLKAQLTERGVSAATPQQLGDDEAAQRE